MCDDVLQNIDAPNSGDILEIANDYNVEEQDRYFHRYAEFDIHGTMSEPEENFESLLEEPEGEPYRSPERTSHRRRSRSVGSRSHFYDILQASYQVTTQLSVTEETLTPDSPVSEITNGSIDNKDAFILSLRCATSASKTKIKRPKVTEPHPFNIKNPKRFEQGAAVRVPPTLAEAIDRWNNAVPARYRSLAKNQKPPITVSHGKTAEHRMTSAKTPPLATLQRHRPANYLGREVLEQKEMEAIRKNGFKAHTIPKGVLTPPEHKELKRVLPTTIPQTPKFSEAGKASLRAAVCNRNVSGSTSTISEAGSTSSGVAENRPRTTEMHPFSFEQRDKQLLRAKEEKIKKIIEEERKQAEFHANPCPSYLHHPAAQPHNPPQNTGQTTQVVPFQLITEARSGAIAKIRKKQEEEKRKENEAAKKFKSKPPTVLHRDPFKPLPAEDKQLTQAVGFHLSTEYRAAKRKEFEHFMKQRDEEIEKARKEREDRKRKEEDEEIARLRREAEFKAQPIHRYKPVEEIPRPEVTIPVTPKFCKK